MDTGLQLMYHKGVAMQTLPLGNGHVDNWADSGIADNSQQTDDTSTDIDTDDRIQVSIKSLSQSCNHFLWYITLFDYLICIFFWFV